MNVGNKADLIGLGLSGKHEGHRASGTTGNPDAKEE
jgi:hypothetical protein